MRGSLALAFVVLTLVMMLGTAGCSSKATAGKEAVPAPAAVKVIVKVQPVKKADLPVTVELVGTVRAQTVVPVGAMYGGRVTEVKAREGDTVKKGQVLVVLDKRDVDLRMKQATYAIEQATKQIEAMTAATALEKETLAIGVKQARAAADQVKANLDKVEAGARPEEQKQVAAAVEAARAQVESMQREVGRLDGLYENKVIPKSQLDKVSDGYKLANAQYNAAMAQLALVNKGARQEDRDAVKAAFAQVEAVLELAQVATKRGEVRDRKLEAAKIGLKQAELAKEIAGRTLEEMDVVAPSDGVIQKKQVEVGGMVGPGTPLFLLVPAGQVAVEGLLTDSQKALVGPGAKGTYSIDALGKSGAGEVLFVSDTVDAVRGGYLVRVAIPQTLQAQARDGMFARIVLATGQVHAGALLVPADAVLHREGRKVVFVVAGGKAAMKSVETGLRQNGEVEVVEGLKAGDRIVSDGHLNLVDGAAVQERQ